jgi:hypothetical protein
VPLPKLPSGRNMDKFPDLFEIPHPAFTIEILVQQITMGLKINCYICKEIDIDIILSLCYFHGKNANIIIPGSDGEI